MYQNAAPDRRCRWAAALALWRVWERIGQRECVGESRIAFGGKGFVEFVQVLRPVRVASVAMTMSSSPCCSEFEYGEFGGDRGSDNDGEFEFGGVCCFYCRCRESAGALSFLVALTGWRVYGHGYEQTVWHYARLVRRKSKYS